VVNELRITAVLKGLYWGWRIKRGDGYHKEVVVVVPPGCPALPLEPGFELPALFAAAGGNRQEKSPVHYVSVTGPGFEPVELYLWVFPESRLVIWMPAPRVL
jgi:hypothetical protein